MFLQSLRTPSTILQWERRDRCRTSSTTDAGHHHAKEACACAADTHGFKIDCGNSAAITAAIDYLNANTGCATARLVQRRLGRVQKQALLLMAHHDYCARRNPNSRRKVSTTSSLTARAAQSSAGTRDLPDCRNGCCLQWRAPFQAITI